MICVRPSQRINTPHYSPAESVRPHPLGQYQSLQAQDHGSRVAKEDHLDNHHHYQRCLRINEKNDGTHLAWKVVYPSCFLRRNLENASWHSVEDLCPASRRTRMSADHLFSSFYTFHVIDLFFSYVVEFRVNFVTATRIVVWMLWYLEMSAWRTVNPVVSTARYTRTPQNASFNHPVRFVQYQISQTFHFFRQLVILSIILKSTTGNK